MADKSIGELPVSQGMTDDALLVVYQNGETESIEGSLIKRYARESTKQYVEGAKQSAEAAAGSAAAAQKSREGVEEYEAKAKASADAAASSAGAAQASAGVADAAKADVAENAVKAKTSADNAKTSETASKASETAAGKSATDADTAKRAAQAAQTAAETAKSGAEGSATAAGNSATQAGQSATAAAGSAGAAAQSATAAGSAKAGAEGARDTAVTAKNDAVAAKTASEAAKTAAEAAKTAAKTSETNSKASETAAAGSKSTAETAAQTATAQAGIATTKAGEAATSAGKAKTSETNSKASETAAKGSETAAAGSAGTAKTEADRAKSEADRAATIVGGDFPTKAEARGYVSTHDAAGGSHMDIRSALSAAQQLAQEAKSLAEGRSRAVSYTGYSSMVAAVNIMSKTAMRVGDNLLLEALGVPDLWVSRVESTAVIYTYTTDAALEDALGLESVQMGYYKLSMLETPKVDLRGYVPAIRTINGKQLTGNITLTAGDVEALPNGGWVEHITFKHDSTLSIYGTEGIAIAHPGSGGIEANYGSILCHENLNMCSNKIFDLALPQDLNDAATKGYVDEQVAEVVPSAGLPISKGGTGATTAAAALAALGGAKATDLSIKRNNDIRTYPVKSGETVQAGDVVDVVGGKVTNGKAPVGYLAIGSIIKLNVGGVPTEFIVAHHGKPSSIYSNTFAGNTILLMKDCVENRQWHITNVNSYLDSTIHTYLNSAFLDLLDSDVKSKVTQVKIPYRPSSGYGTDVNSGENGLAARVWLLSGYEVGWTYSTNIKFPADGAKLSYFISGITSAANAKRIGYLGGAVSYWHLRSPYCEPDYSGSAAGFVTKDGSSGAGNCSNAYGIRPAFALPDDFTYPTIDTTQAIALQSGTGGQNVDVIFDGVAELPGITAGTSIASPGVQGYAPQDGWLWVKPEWDAKPFVVGSYVGDGTRDRLVSLGFEPSAVFVADEYGREIETNWAYGGFTIKGHPLKSGDNCAKITITGGGFLVSDSGSGSSGTKTNTSGEKYHYIAFRG